MLRLLFLLDELPYPPHCGVTNTTFPLMTGLSAANEVSLLWLRQPGQAICEDAVAECRRRFRHVWVADLHPSGRCLAGLKELAGVTPYFGSATLDLPQCRRMLSGYDCDVLWCAPIRPLAYASAINGVLPPRARRVTVAAINDSYTATLRARGRQTWGRFWPLRARIAGAAGWARSYAMPAMENRLLQSADCVVVQTEKDRTWVSRVTNGRLAHAAHVISNGVNPELLRVPAPELTATFGHAGSLRMPSNTRTVQWLLRQVLPAVQRACPNATLSVLGSAGPPGLMRRLAGNAAVRYVPRVEKMQEFFAGAPILVVRNYKDIGVINRTIEAMGAGVVVVGEPGAFNGIRRFRHGVHGFVAERTDEVADILIRLFSDRSRIAAVSQAARALIRQDFRWEDRLAFVQRLLEGMTYSDPPASRTHAA